MTSAPASRALGFLVLAAGLAACGGGGGGGGAPAPAATLTGVFTDAPVAGLDYSTDSGLSGTTGSGGEFEYREGDVVTFSAGPIPVGSVTAEATITPRELAAAIAGENVETIPEIAQNLFRFFQSLDLDSDPNTITLPDPAALAAIDFTADISTAAAFFGAADFETVLTGTVDEISTALDVPLSVVSVEAALQHAYEQAQILIAGTWVFRSSGSVPGPVNTITFFGNGQYLYGGLQGAGELEGDPDCKTDDPGADDGGNGAEFGTFEWNPLTSAFTSGEPLSDSTGTCGPAGVTLDEQDRPNLALQVVGAQLRFYAMDLVLDEGNTFAEQCVAENGVTGTFHGREACIYTLDRAAGTAVAGTAPVLDGLEGSYSLASAVQDGVPFVLTLERSGASTYRYLLVGVEGGNEGDPSDGIEIGTLTVDGQGNVTSLIAALDTNGSGGLAGSDLRLTLDENNDLVLDDLVEGEVVETTVITRVPVLLPLVVVN